MTQKNKKFERLANKIISECISEDLDLDMQNFGIINITGINISDDRSYLDIYVSCFKNQSDLTKYMSEYTHEIQKKLGKKIETYKIPRVRFRYDESGEIGQEIHNTIASLKH